MALAPTFISVAILLLSSLNLFSVNANSYTEFLRKGQSVRISDTFVSYGGNYELGFFSRDRDNSTKYYVGIWFKKVPNDKIVWVANRDYAFQTSSAFLIIQPDGNIAIRDGPMTYLVTNVSKNSYSTYATLLDSGNLVLLNNSNKAVLWQSFNNPTDTLLPGMTIGHDIDTGYDFSLTSWTSADDPAIGPYTLRYDSGSASLTVNKGSNVLWIDGNSNLSIQIVFNRAGMEQASFNDYFTLPIYSHSRFVLDVSGDLKYEDWSEKSKRWIPVQSSKCGANNSCGVFSICNPQDHDPCQCLSGFEPFDGDSWRKGNRSAGCVRLKNLSCNTTDGFLRFVSGELPPNHVNVRLDSIAQCNYTCFTNCSCVAFAYDLFAVNCMLWSDEVLTLKNISTDKNPNFFYLKLAASDILTTSNVTNAASRHGKRKKNLIIIVLLISFLILLILLGLFVYQTRKQSKKGEDLLNFEVGMSMKVNQDSHKGTKVKRKEVKLPLFSFVSVSAATNNFSDTNKLGEGGFGPVYKGTLLNGDEVAVKRLSKRSGQGWEELRNEALLIAKLQHNNLVRLLGCCIERDEKMLIYEFMANTSLDCFLFDAEKREMLDWGTRVRIIEGIAQGLLYLHQYSRFRIIHRDLKASNILLDTNMNPKISDFGMARIFSENVLQANTNRIVGTYGYMSPEYAMEGIFSIKSDVFSFGVLLLEIISGKKNTGFYQTNSFDLLGYAWNLWTNNCGMDLIDSKLDDISNKHLVTKYVNIGLLCVQQSPEDRPSMSDVVSMIGNDTASLPNPKPPAFQNVRGMENSSLSTITRENNSVNVVTNSIVEAR
ncbi:G-type lectin S-receptor-like serine/threonine-protein kinase At1g11330 isoform X2 [Vicia villosa]|uniref:G-type lectin S-receptor-like serine/threonine-protein kinase At1g11330 isoform X2 n=1 Tax=Vicia villosa TaxID=3911 RepID=UPI00273C7A65|nr:G-type lectin S-receptor-like serine/threonine-protein kinase At1g11330 isoform X2 [Vicia villosa]